MSGQARDEAVIPRRVLMVAGGTGGHIFPAIAVAKELRARSSKEEGEGRSYLIQFLGAGRELESRVIEGEGFSLKTISAAGLKGIHGWKRIRNFLVLPRTMIETAGVLRAFDPDVVVGIGGYLSGPVMLEAALKGTPTLLFEPNIVPGFTNRVLAPVVRMAAVGFEETARFYGRKARVTGHPVRQAMFKVQPKEHKPPFTVLIMGGSQGSRAINETVLKSLSSLSVESDRLRIVHQTGMRDYEPVQAAYRQFKINAEICPFIEDISSAFQQADLVISRSGAMAVAELAAAGKASVLIPFPAATDHHQLQNARAMERAGAARVIEQGDLNPARLVKEMWNLLDHPDELKKMEECARSHSRPGGAERMADLIEELAVQARKASKT